MDSSRCLLQRRWPEESDPRVSCRLEWGSQTFCVYRHCGIQHGKTASLPTNSGEDSARLHPASEQKEWTM